VAIRGVLQRVAGLRRDLRNRYGTAVFRQACGQ